MGFRYIGAKTRLLNKIIDKISSLVGPGSHIVDLMSGTGSVSLSLKNAGYKVTANDIMTYSFHHCTVLLLLREYPSFKSAKNFIRTYYKKNTEYLFSETNYEIIINSLNNVTPLKGYFWREFSPAGKPTNGCKVRNYFSPDNASKIDAIRAAIRKLYLEGNITSLEHSLLLHDLILAANDYANIAGTYGHYLSKIVNRTKEPFQVSPSKLTFINNKIKHKVFQEYAEDLASKIKCDLCYIDPPYMKRQYAANYHLLETLAREDEPEAVGVSGLRPWRDQYSNFCTKTKIRDSFRKIFGSMKCDNFLISYSEDGLLTIEELDRLFSEFGTVNIEEIKYKRFKSNNTKLPSTLTEYLIFLKRFQRVLDAT